MTKAKFVSHFGFTSMHLFADATIAVCTVFAKGLLIGSIVIDEKKPMAETSKTAIDVLSIV